MSIAEIQKSILAMSHAYVVLQRIRSVLDKEKDLRKRFYQIIEDNHKVEFINGKIIFHTPSQKRHQDAVGNLIKLLPTFTEKHNLGWVGFYDIMVSLTRNDYEPDVCFWKQSKAKDFTEDQMQFPAPDLVVEVLSKSTENRDRTIKYEDYEAHGVKEYWIIDPTKQTIEQYVLSHKKYELLFKGKDGNIESVAMKNFKIPVRAIFDKRLTNKVLTELLK
jgi:Uma2 family endonuclease